MPEFSSAVLVPALCLYYYRVAGYFYRLSTGVLQYLLYVILLSTCTEW